MKLQDSNWLLKRRIFRFKFKHHYLWRIEFIACELLLILPLLLLLLMCAAPFYLFISLYLLLANAMASVLQCKTSHAVWNSMPSGYLTCPLAICLPHICLCPFSKKEVSLFSVCSGFFFLNWHTFCSYSLNQCRSVDKCWKRHDKYLTLAMVVVPWDMARLVVPCVILFLQWCRQMA